MPKGVPNFQEAFSREESKKRGQESKEKQSRRGGFDFWKPPKGTSVVRILPPGSERLMSRGEMGKVVFKHALFWDGKPQGTFTSGPKTHPEVYKDCPIQTALDQVTGIVPDDQVKKWQARPRALFNLLIRRMEDPLGNPIQQDTWGKVVLGDCPSGMQDFVNEDANNPNVGFFIDPYDGQDVLIIRTGDSFETTKYRYTVKPGAWGPILTTKEETDALIEKLVDLDKFTLIREPTMKKMLVAAQAILAYGARFKADLPQELRMARDTLMSLMEVTRTAVGKEDTEEDEGPMSPEELQAAVAHVAPQPRDLTTLNPAPAAMASVATVATAVPAAPATVATAVPAAPATVATAAPVAQPAAPSTSGGPQMNADGKQPVCYLQFPARNPGAVNGTPVDPICKVCNFRLPCYFDTMPA